MCRKTQHVKIDVEMFAEEPVPQYIQQSGAVQPGPLGEPE